MLYLTNALSLNMFNIERPIHISITPLTLEQAKWHLNYDKNFVSAIGHEDTARILSNMLGMEIKANRISVKLTQDDYAIIAQYTGPRLPEGATTLPVGAEIKFYMVIIQ